MKSLYYQAKTTRARCSIIKYEYCEHRLFVLLYLFTTYPLFLLPLHIGYAASYFYTVYLLFIEDELVDLFKDIGEVIDAFVLPCQNSNSYTYG